jgi:hypothetical protein
MEELKSENSPGRDEEAHANLNLLRSLYYDAASPGEGHFASLAEFVGTDHILFGTDGGWTQPLEMSLKIKSFMAYDEFTDSDRDAIQHANASSLFPGLGSATHRTADARA